MEWQDKRQLYLKLPQLSAGTIPTGEIRVRSGLGERTYKTSQLERPLFVPVIPQLPLVEVVASEELAAVGVAVSSAVARFRSSGNFFRVSESGGRLLAPNEPLECGEQYWLLTQRVLPSAPLGLGLEIECREEQRGWYLYEIALPLSLEASAMRAVTEYLERAVKVSRARAYIVEPPSHHIELDGTYVFPETTKRFLIRRTAPSAISIEGIEGADINEIADGWVAIAGLGIGSFAVSIGGRVELLGRIERCDLFQPRGVRIAIGDSSWEIFEPSYQQLIAQRSPQGVRIECPTGHVADSIRLEHKAWSRDGTRFVLVEQLVGEIDAKNFGALTSGLRGESSAQMPFLDEAAAARRVWLEGIVASHHGPDLLLRLRQQWDKDPWSCGDVDSSGRLAWLRPYFQVCRSI